MRSAVERTQKYIEEHFAEEITLEQLAVISRLSPYHLTRAFHKEVGLPPHEYLIEVRIEAARQLLRRGIPIVQVAQDTGFADQSHMTRSFKSRLGITPGRLRKNF